MGISSCTHKLYNGKAYLYICVIVCVKSLSCEQLFATPWTGGPPGSSVHGILQARIPEWVAVPYSRGSFRPGIKPGSAALQADSLPTEPPEKPMISHTQNAPFFIQKIVSYFGILFKRWVRETWDWIIHLIFPIMYFGK